MMGTQKRTGARSFLVTLAVLLVAAIVVLAAIRLIGGKPLGLRSLLTGIVSSPVNTIKMAWNGRAIAGDSRGEYNNIIFLHHSTGTNLVRDGKVRELFTEQGFNFYDHGYNRQGLRYPSGQGARYNYNVPNDNTDPVGLITIFRQPLLPTPVNTFSALMQHEVIIVKSCFAPGNNIASDAQLAQYQQWYIEMRGVMQEHPEKLFIILTMPPLNPAETNPEQAARARKFAQWVNSEEFLAGSANIFVFDFYDRLAEDDPGAPDVNMLRAEYREGSDSHPLKVANEAIGPDLVKFVAEKAATYRTAIAVKDR